MASKDIIKSVHGNPGQRRFWFKVFLVLCRVLLHITVNGRENIPAGGPLIIVINHIGLLDPVTVMATTPRLIIPMAKEEAFDLPVYGPFLKMFGTIPVHRDQVDVTAIKLALGVLNQDGAILLAPEGTRSRNCRLQPGKDGAVLLALRSGATILPVGITGTHAVKTHWTRLRRVPVTLNIGQPFKLALPHDKRKASKAEVAALTRQVMYRVAALIPPEFRGVYGSPPVGEDSRVAAI